MSKGFFPIRLSLELFLLGTVAIAILLRLLNLGSRELWYDEVLSLLVATGRGIDYKPPAAVPVALSDYNVLLRIADSSGIGDAIATKINVLKSLLADVHPPLYFLSLHFWVRLFGNSEAALRSLSALFSIGAIGGAYGLGRFVLGHRGGLLLAALLATNTFYLFHSLNARMYAPLVLWTVLSAWAMLQLLGHGEKDKNIEETGVKPQVTEEGEGDGTVSVFDRKPHAIWWNILLILAVAAGLLTQYLFAYWVLSLGILVLVLDRRHWWHHGLRLSAGVLLTAPWAIWGVRGQGRLKDVGSQFAKGNHLEDVAQTLGTHLVAGDWVTSLPKETITVIGCIAIALLIAAIVSLWRQGLHQSLRVALCLGIVPLLLALIVDIITRKYSIGFGGGRSMLFILPGCLLLVAVWLIEAAGRWQKVAIAVLLLLYLTVGIADYSIRGRRIYYQLTEIVQSQPNTPTILAMNSLAWGHILRLAYYLPPTSEVKLLAQHPANLAPTLETILKTPQAAAYPRLIWLDSARPVNKAPKTEAQTQKIQKDIQKVLNSRFKQVKTQSLSGTMILDKFTVNLYARSAAKDKK